MGDFECGLRFWLFCNGQYCDGRMNAEEICLCFILVVASCECQATHVFDEMLVRKFIAFKKKFFDEMDRLALEMNL
jgi:hypothetical protein